MASRISRLGVIDSGITHRQYCSYVVLHPNSKYLANHNWGYCGRILVHMRFWVCACCDLRSANIRRLPFQTRVSTRLLDGVSRAAWNVNAAVFEPIVDVFSSIWIRSRDYHVYGRTTLAENLRKRCSLTMHSTCTLASVTVLAVATTAP